MKLVIVVIARLVLACGHARAIEVEPLRPRTEALVMSDGAVVHVKVSGAGPVCMFIHGGPGQGTLSFEKMGGDRLEKFLTMVYVDQRGSGRSPDTRDYHLERVVQDLDEVRAKLGVAKACLIAHSFGGILAVAYARRFPDRVSSLVMANATLQFLGPHQRRMQTLFIHQLLGITTEVPGVDDPQLDTAADEAWSALMKSSVGYRVLTEHLTTIKRMSEIDGSYPRSRGFGAAVFDEREAYPEYYLDYAPSTAAITQPVLVIAGAKDHAVGPAEHARFRFPDQHVTTLDTGHISYFDANAAFVTAIQRFISAVDPATPR